MTKRNTKKQTKPQVIDVEFTINAPAAKIVCLAGSFNQWCPESLPLQRNGDGPWRIKLPLPAGRHEYKYVVDGQWQPDPNAKESAPNSFDSLNSVLEVK